MTPNNHDALLLERVFQGQIKQIKEFADQQKDAYDYANKYLKGSYDDGLLALSTFFAEQKRLRDAGNVQAELESIDKEIAAANELKSKASKPETRQQAENTIAEAVLKRARIVAKGGAGRCSRAAGRSQGGQAARVHLLRLPVEHRHLAR
jgi:hypothetical protein